MRNFSFFFVLHKQIYAIEFLLVVFLIAFAFKDLVYLYLTTNQHAKKTLQHDVVPLVAQKAFYHPVKPDIVSHSDSNL